MGAKLPGTKGVVVVGAGGPSKFKFLEYLSEIASLVVLFEHEIARSHQFPKGIFVVFLAQFTPSEMLAHLEALGLRRKISSVTTVNERCVECAARLALLLGVFGLRPAEARLFRDKSVMLPFLGSIGLDVPKWGCVAAQDDMSAILLEADRVGYPLVAKPDNGSANLGVRYIKSRTQFSNIWKDAIAEAHDVEWTELPKGSIGRNWILSKYVEGREFQADIYVCHGSVRFCAIQEKPLIFRVGSMIYENSAVFPTMTTSRSENAKIKQRLGMLSQHIHLILANIGINRFCIYTEFILPSGSSEPSFLEVAFRPGGAYCSDAILLGTGVSTFKLAALSAVNRQWSGRTRTKCSVAWQIIFSDRCGCFLGFEGLEKLEGHERIAMCASIMTEIRVPTAQYLAFVSAEGATPRQAYQRSNVMLGKIVLCVSDRPGNIARIRTPTKSDLNGCG